ncbi:sphingosine kinase [Malassezia sp. CBS 17886]|nr:sphingosine kinase [Malassezia sp. CBS 17886]
MSTSALSAGCINATLGSDAVTLCVAGDRLEIGHGGPHRVSVPAALVLSAEVLDDALSVQIQVKFLAHRPSKSFFSALRTCLGLSRKPGGHVVTEKEWYNRHERDLSRLSKMEVCAAVPEDSRGAAHEWVKVLLAAAFPVPVRRRILVICNPVGGQGKGRAVLRESVLPILEAAACDVTTVATESRDHAFRTLYELDTRQHDAVMCIGGDGTMHEVINGLAARTDAQDALQLPVVPVPSGSGNGLYVSLHGTEAGFSVPLACLAALKGVPYDQELCTVTQPLSLFGDVETTPSFVVGVGANGEKYVQYYSFMSLSIGLVANVDIGTEAFRFMGEARFSLGYLFGAFMNRQCDVCVDIVFGRQGTTDHDAMRDRAAAPDVPVDERSRMDDFRTLRLGSVTDPLPEKPVPYPILRGQPLAAPTPDQMWHRIDCAMSSLYAGKVPYVARGFMAFPYVHPSDGTVDLLIQRQDSTAAEKIVSMVHGESGSHIRDASIEYAKVEGFRVTPHAHVRQRTQYLSIDGESKPYGPVQLEVSPLRIRMLTLSDDQWRAPTIRPPNNANDPTPRGDTT